MPTALELQCHAILTAAAGAEIGICIRTNNPYKARISLYNARNAFGDSEFADLQIRVSPNDTEGEIWLLKKSAANKALSGVNNLSLL